MNKLLVAVALVAAGATTAQPVFASSTGNPVSISLGVNFPSQATAQSFGGTSQFAVNASYALMPTSKNGTPLLFLDYTTGGNGGASEDSFGGGVGFRTGHTFYGGADLGLYSTTARVPNIVPGIGPGTFSRSSTAGGGRIYIGGNLTQGSSKTIVFAEGGYRFLPSVGGVNPSGFGISLGVRLRGY